MYRTAQSLSKKYPIPFNWIEKYAIRRASVWICSGGLVGQNLATRPGYDALPRAQIPLGVDINCFCPNRSAGADVRHSLGWSADGPPVVGYLGRFVPEKGLEILQSALDNVAVPWRALFVGAGPSEPSLRAWAERHGDRVRICNQVTHDQVPAYLNAMDVMCAPSQTAPNWKEQFGRMVVEAFASGVPFIGSDSGEIPFLVKDTGVIVGERDVLGWTNAITALIEDRRRCEELAELGLARARQEFAWPVVARRYLEFFDAILDSKVRAAS